MNKDPFDFGAFVSKAQNPDDETRKQILRDAVSDELDAVMGEVAPRIWCVLQEQMMKDPKNNIHLNAVMNAGIFALLGWVAACTPAGGTGDKDNDDMLRQKIMANLDNALANARDQAPEMSRIGHSAGKMKLMEDCCEGIADILTANSQIIQGVHSTIKNMQSRD
tara:strand:- start:70 stop:564 length:495 start_codon:yes stop_codon:yes gene_type:complete